MKTKIVGILVCTLLIATALPAVGTMNKIDDKLNDASVNEGSGSPRWFWNVDQQQTSSSGWGFTIQPPYWYAQSFKPTKEKLTAVQLYMFKHDDPPAGIEITVSIRDDLNGSDLTITTINADEITKRPRWIWFNFPDIDTTPEQTYYIVCRSDGGVGNDTYCWLFDFDNPYDRGEAWESNDSDASWNIINNPEWPELDACFKTYHRKNIANDIPFFVKFFDRHSRMFPILRHILNLLL